MRQRCAAFRCNGLQHYRRNEPPCQQAHGDLSGQCRCWSGFHKGGKFAGTAWRGRVPAATVRWLSFAASMFKARCSIRWGCEFGRIIRRDFGGSRRKGAAWAGVVLLTGGQSADRPLLVPPPSPLVPPVDWATSPRTGQITPELPRVSQGRSAFS